MADFQNFDINIADFKALDKLAKYVDSMPYKIERALEDAMEEIAHRVHARMLTELANYGLGASELASSITVRAYSGGMVIEVGAEHAMYVEFGTGVVGAQSSHPSPSFFGKPFGYASGPQSSKGEWWYEIDKGYADSRGIPTQQGQNGKWYAKTKGMRSRPFVYKSYLYARRIVTRTVNKHLKRVL